MAKKNNNSTFETISLIFKIIFLPLTILFAIAGAIGEEQIKTNNKSKYTDKELDAYGLLKEEKELVKKGEYEPWQFEEDPDEMDSDDYYYDDF